MIMEWTDLTGKFHCTAPKATQFALVPPPPPPPFNAAGGWEHQDFFGATFDPSNELPSSLPP